MRLHHLNGWQVHAGRPGEWIHADLTIAPWRDEDGRIAGCIGRGADVAALAPQREAAQTRYSATLDLMTDLQDALLPADLPVAPALDISAIYLLAADDARAGGDWFDAILRPDGTVALVVGDTVGQGITASAVMGQLRAVLHERLLGDDSISDALRSLDRYARLRPESHAATVCVAVVDPATGEVEYCTAGHPAPLVVASDGSARFFEPSGAGPLTTESEYPTSQETLGTDDMILLFTDGLTDRPGVPPAASTRGDRPGGGPGRGRAATARRRGGRPWSANARSEALTRTAGFADDITLLAAHRTPAFPPFRSTIQPSPDVRSRGPGGAGRVAGLTAGRRARRVRRAARRRRAHHQRPRARLLRRRATRHARSSSTPRSSRTASWSAPSATAARGATGRPIPTGGAGWGWSAAWSTS